MIRHHAVRKDFQRNSRLRLGDDLEECAVVADAVKQPFATNGAVEDVKNNTGGAGPGTIGHATT